VRKRGLDQVIIIKPEIRDTKYNAVSWCCEKCAARSS